MDGYPKAKFHIRGGGSVLVTSAQQEKALGAEWVDTKPIPTSLPEPLKRRGRPPLKPNEGPRPN